MTGGHAEEVLINQINSEQSSASRFKILPPQHEALSAEHNALAGPMA